MSVHGLMLLNQKVWNLQLLSGWAHADLVTSLLVQYVNHIFFSTKVLRPPPEEEHLMQDERIQRLLTMVSIYHQSVYQPTSYQTFKH